MAMGKGRTRTIEKGGLKQNLSASTTSSTSTSSKYHSFVPQAPVYHPTEDEFKDPLKFISKIRPEAEQFGICCIVPPKSWSPPFAIDAASFTFPTKSQAIHQLQARPASCDPKTFELEYVRFLEGRGGKKVRKRVVFEGEELDLCRLFNSVKRFGGYDKVCEERKWGDVVRFVRSVVAGKASQCSKHVLRQLYRDHLFDYEEYQRQLEKRSKRGKRSMACKQKKRVEELDQNRKRKNGYDVERVNVVINDKMDQICEQCRSGLHGEVMLLCDRCDKGWHLHCLSPPLEHVPVGNWYCFECVSSDKDNFGFVPGKQYMLETFRRFNNRTKRKLFGLAGTSRSQMEMRFWEIIEGKAGELEVMYGSDLDTSLHGSGFPRTADTIPPSVNADSWKEYASSPWNLNNLPKLQDSLLHVVQDNIAGVMVPWLYIGMLFSSFCWHIEDHCLYSINYLHWGEPKCWYGVPGSKGHAFEQVMKNTLPDLFDVQPDLLFQLVTMLNPSVLLDNGVPVYGVLQEPGNFVITFPRSFHGGFNLGLNCAEAVNFAPADWLPHGGFGAEQYRLYHRPAVLSHEELLYVVAKSSFDANVSPYLKKELARMFTKEKILREMLWESGIINSSQLPPHKHPEYMGTEEDPTCIICHQYLYLSAVTCSCRPSAFVCLEHWRLLCECESTNHHLLYRQSLAELNDLVHVGSVASIMTGDFEEIPSEGDFYDNISCTQLSFAKKIIGGHIAHVQLAEDWLRNSSHLLQIPFSGNAYARKLKEAEQFLWGDHEMDPVRDMVKTLAKAQKWATDLQTCLAKIDNWFYLGSKDSDRVRLNDINELLNLNPLPCDDHRYFKLKAYAEEASKLDIELEGALSSLFNIGIDDLEELYIKTTKSPIHLAQTERLAKRISFIKLWRHGVRHFILDREPGEVEIETLYKFKKEMMELQVQLPEVNLLLIIIEEAETWENRCQGMLESSPLNLKELEMFLEGANEVIVSIPKLKLLKQYLTDARSWISRVQNSLRNFIGREDYGNIVIELNNILTSGRSLEVWVDEVNLVEVELRKAHFLEKAFKIKQSLDRSLSIYSRSRECSGNLFFICCSNDSEQEDAFTCLMCGDQYHFSCIGQPPAIAGMTNEYACPFCLYRETGFISRSGVLALIHNRKHTELKSFLELLSDTEEFYLGVQERDLVKEITSKATDCQAFLAKIVNQVFDHFDKDLTCVSEGLLTALKAVAVAGVYSQQDCGNLKIALRRHSWKIKVKKILNNPRKPTLHQIQRLIKEGYTRNITGKDHFLRELTYIRHIGLQWSDLAKEIVSDSGALELREVYNIIDQGEKLPVHLEKEMKLLRDRSVLYCICRKPDDQRPMIACDQCDEWYHFDCINMRGPPPRTFFCPACKPLGGDFISLFFSVPDEARSIEDAPRTPPPLQNISKRTCFKKARILQYATESAPDMKLFSCSSEIDFLWRENRCLRRTAKRRRQFESLLFFNSTVNH